MPRPVGGQCQLDRLHPGGESVQGHEEAACRDEGEEGQIGDHEAVDASDEGAHEEAQWGCCDGRQHHEWQAGQYLGWAQGKCLNEQGPAEKDGALEHEGLSERGHRLADRPRQRAVGENAHPQQGAADAVGVGLAGDLKGDEAADRADAAGEEHGAEGRVGLGRGLGAPAG